MEPETEQEYSPKRDFTKFFSILIMIVLGVILFNSPLFTLRKVTVTGNKHLSAEDVVRIAGIQEGGNFFQVHGSEVNRILMTEPWIAGAHVSKNFPNSITIQIRERQPQCTVYYRGNWIVISTDGVVVDVRPAASKPAYPQITGLALKGIRLGDHIHDPLFQRAQLIITSTTDAIRPMISKVEMSTYCLELMLPNSKHILLVELGDDQQLAKKLTSLNEIISNTTFTNYVKIDLRSPDFPTGTNK